MRKPVTVGDALKGATVRLAEAGMDTARLDAEFLLSGLLGCRRLALVTRAAEVLPADVSAKFDDAVQRREQYEPVAYILGEQEFWSLTFKVTPATLIPRPDTETLVEVGLRNLAPDRAARALDLGTGSGCILISLMHERSQAMGVGVDQSAEALEVAVTNAEAHRLADRVRFHNASWFAGLDAGKDRFDLIVSNPPYIPSRDIAGLMTDVRDFEPISALDGGDDGLEPYRLIIRESWSYLADGGVLAVEIGVDQAEAVHDLFTSKGFSDITTDKDLAGRERVVSGKK